MADPAVYRPLAPAARIAVNRSYSWHASLSEYPRLLEAESKLDRRLRSAYAIACEYGRYHIGFAKDNAKGAAAFERAREIALRHAASDPYFAVRAGQIEQRS